MNMDLLDVLCCAKCRGALSSVSTHVGVHRIQDGALACNNCHAQFPIVNYIPRFVPSENYSENFGFQWNKFRLTQLDSHTGLPLSRERFFDYSGWNEKELKGKWVLDVGCGAGRFAEVALSAGANVCALDYSSAVDACWSNLGSNTRLNVLQASIYELPFKPGSFDFVYCFGVLQHTPDVNRAFMALPGLVKHGGKLAIDVYPKLFRNVFWSKYWLRPITKRLSQEKTFKLTQLMVDSLLPISLRIGRIPFVGRKLRYAIPVANHEPDWPLSPAQVYEWAVLNTFDMLAPVHDHPQSKQTVRRWFESAGFHDIEVFRRGFYVGRGSKPI